MKLCARSLMMVFVCAAILVMAPLAAQANKQITLDRDTNYWNGGDIPGQFLCAKGHVVLLYDDDTLREGYIKYGAHFYVKGGTYVNFKEGFMGFHRNGMVRYGALDGNYYLYDEDGNCNEYRANPNKTIFFNEDGEVTGYY
ncbi:MAG: hypothetical protein H6Q67_1815 [Firmicutes bacterium]|nr:hypothetical protein [Bacillota bacterium]